MRTYLAFMAPLLLGVWIGRVFPSHAQKSGISSFPNGYQTANHGRISDPELLATTNFALLTFSTELRYIFEIIPRKNQLEAMRILIRAIVDGWADLEELHDSVTPKPNRDLSPPLPPQPHVSS